MLIFFKKLIFASMSDTMPKRLVFFMPARRVCNHLHFNSMKKLHSKRLFTQKVDFCIFEQKNCAVIKKNLFSRGTKVEKMLTLAPERYTAEFCMVAKVIIWCI